MKHRADHGRGPAKLLAAGLLFVCYSAAAGPVDAPEATRTLECYLIENASIIEAGGARRETNIANFGHQIANGKGWVISIREFYDAGPPDAQEFKKLTLEFRFLPILSKVGRKQDVRIIRGYFTEGASAFTNKADFATSSTPLSSFTLQRTNRGFQIGVKATFTLIEARDGAVKPTEFDWTCPLIQRSASQLSVWQGRPGTDDNPYYPPRTIR